MRLHWFVPLVFVACNPLDDCKTDPPLQPTECIAQRVYEGEPYAPSDADECGDDFEPNEDITQATTESRRACSSVREGHIRNTFDIDVFRTGACDRGRLASVGDTRISVTSTFETDPQSGTEPDLRLCVFAMCHDGATNLQACIGEGDDGRTIERVDHETKETPKRLWSTRLASGFTGCCRVGEGSLEVEVVCQYASREIDTYFWVDSIDPDATCSGYQVSYNVD